MSLKPNADRSLISILINEVECQNSKSDGFFRELECRKRSTLLFRLYSKGMCLCVDMSSKIALDIHRYNMSVNIANELKATRIIVVFHHAGRQLGPIL